MLHQNYPLLVVLGAQVAGGRQLTVAVDVVHDALDYIPKGILEKESFKSVFVFLAQYLSEVIESWRLQGLISLSKM